MEPTVAVLLLSALCGVHSASIPSNSDELDKSDSTLEAPLDYALDSILESKLDSELDTDNLKQSVLEGVKKLLDSKLSSLAKNGDRSGSDGIPKQRPFKPKSRMRPILNRKDRTNLESNSSEEDSQNSEFVKMLKTDDPNQDIGDEELRDAVDELLEGNKNNDDTSSSDERTPYPEQLTDYNSDEKISKDSYDDITTQVNKNKMETPTSSRHDKNGYNDEINTLTNSTDKNVGFRRKLLKNNLKQSSKKGKDLLDFSESEKQEDSYEDILDKLIKEDIETEISENKNQELIDLKEKPKRKLGKHHNNYRRIGREKLEKNYNDKYERISKPKPTDLTVTNDLIDSKESWLDSILKFDKKETQKETHHDIPLQLGKLDEENQKQAEDYDSRSSISKENSYNEELNDNIYANNFDENNGIVKDIAYEEKEHDFQLKDFINNKKKANKVKPDEKKYDKRIQEDIKFRNEEYLTASDNDVNSRSESVMGKYLKDGDDIFENEDDITERDSDVTYMDKINNTGKKKHVTKNKLNTEEAQVLPATSRNDSQHHEQTPTEARTSCQQGSQFKFWDSNFRMPSQNFVWCPLLL
ncbi:general transcription factor 3C polypeptide 5-like [Cydia fagiglandana]|uniref:general transcription factor 3C polypeptide 5-like n=1 Tax=Cydia fagiglandana TaxID=1458189 RepID=UPI002FEE07F3